MTPSQWKLASFAHGTATIDQQRSHTLNKDNHYARLLEKIFQN